MPRRRYQRPIAVFEHGTRLYAPTEGDSLYRIISRDLARKRLFFRLRDEDAARQRARELDAQMRESVAPQGRPPTPQNVAQLAERYLTSLGSRSGIPGAAGLPPAHLGRAGHRQGPYQELDAVVGLDPAIASMLLGHANAAFTLSRYVGVRGDIDVLTTSATESW